MNKYQGIRLTGILKQSWTWKSRTRTIQ